MPDLRSILTGLLENLRPTVIRGLMTDEEWAIFAPFLITASSRGGRPAMNHRHRLDGHTLDLPNRSATARFAGGVRQMELRVEAIPSLVRDWLWDLLLQALADGGGALDILQR